jgi:3-phenylpropionate/trans-cinnamate dioxygenase ferredoxin reductase subunit
LVIVASGPAGVGAAEAFRQHDTDSPVRIMTNDPDHPYARPPLSKEFLRGDTDDVELHPAEWFAVVVGAGFIGCEAAASLAT